VHVITSELLKCYRKQYTYETPLQKREKPTKAYCSLDIRKSLESCHGFFAEEDMIAFEENYQRLPR
jgi:hypothetical protein